jgi:hypothetical protein
MKQTQNEKFQERVLANQETVSAGEMAKIGLTGKQLIENAASFNQFLLEIDKTAFETKNEFYALGKDLKTGNIGGKAPSIEINSRRMQFVSFLKKYQMDGTAKAFAQDVYFDFVASNSLKGALNKLLYGFRVMFGKEDKEGKEQGLYK